VTTEGILDFCENNSSTEDTSRPRKHCATAAAFQTQSQNGKGWNIGDCHALGFRQKNECSHVVSTYSRHNAGPPKKPRSADTQLLLSLFNPWKFLNSSAESSKFLH